MPNFADMLTALGGMDPRSQMPAPLPNPIGAGGLGGMPAPQPMPVGPAPSPIMRQPEGMDWRRLLTLLGPAAAAAALAATGHPNAARGAAEGALNAQHEAEQMRLWQQRVALEEQDRQMRMAQIATAAEEKRQAGIQNLLMTAVKTLPGTKTKADYDAQVSILEGLGAQYGMRPNAIRAAMPFRLPNTQQIMADAAAKFVKNPANKEAIAQGNLTGSVLLDVQGDGVPVPVPVRDVLKAGGVQFDPQSGAPVVVPKTPTKAAGVQLDDEAFLGAVSKFEADKGRPATQSERGQIATQTIEEMAKKRRQGTASVVVQTGTGASDAAAIADAIVKGDQPPDLKGLYRMGPAVRAELARRGYDMRTAQVDWAATQRWVATANGTQQTRMRQAIDNAYHSLDVIEDLAQQWRGGKFPLINRGRVAAAKGGALGAEAQKIATQLDAQISDVTSELANVYMGGNSPTDHAMELARRNLSSDWTESQLVAAVNLARRNLQIRQNSMTNTQPVTPGSAPAIGEPGGSGVEVWTFGPDGKLRPKSKGK